MTPPGANAPLRLPEKEAAALAEHLSSWFAKNHRKLPFRGTSDPYRIWLSEIMLQQTRVDTVIPYYEKFLKNFPNAQSLAAAPLEKVLGLWAGLGYYARARLLHRAAKCVVSEFQGEFPKDAEGLRKLPGVGAYTAGAIASIAYGLPEPAVDGNVVRVLSRLLLWKADTASPKDREAARPLVREILVHGDPAALTPALMELGATICTTANPGCAACPVEKFCEARRKNRVKEFPLAVERKKPKPVKLVALALTRKDGRVLLRRRPEEGGLFGGLWEIPCTKKNGKVPTTLSKLAGEMGFKYTREAKRLGKITHVLSHRKMDVELWAAPAPAGKASGKWVAPAEPDGLPLSALQRKLLALIV